MRCLNTKGKYGKVTNVEIKWSIIIKSVMMIIFVEFIDQLIDYPINRACQPYNIALYMPASVAQLDVPSDWRPGGRGFNPRRGRQHSFVEIDHEIFSTVILSLPLIQEGQLSVSGERVCTILA